MVEREAIGHAPPTVPNDVGPVDPEAVHDRGHVARHVPLGIGGADGGVGGCTAVTIAAQIRQDAAVCSGQGGQHGPPAAMVLRNPVQQDQRRALSSLMHGETGAVIGGIS